MIYVLFGSVLAFVLSYVFFEVTKDFKRKAGWLPPQVIYRQDQYGLKSNDILWQTPRLSKCWSNDEIVGAMFVLFILRWGLIGVGLFFLATFLSHLLHLTVWMSVPGK